MNNILEQERTEYDYRFQDFESKIKELERYLNTIRFHEKTYKAKTGKSEYTNI